MAEIVCKCPACMEVNDKNRRHDTEPDNFYVAICRFCGHIFIASKTGESRNFTRAEMAVDVTNNPMAGTMRKLQAEIVEWMIG